MGCDQKYTVSSAVAYCLASRAGEKLDKTTESPREGTEHPPLKMRLAESSWAHVAFRSGVSALEEAAHSQVENDRPWEHHPASFPRHPGGAPVGKRWAERQVAVGQDWEAWFSSTSTPGAKLTSPTKAGC